MIDIDPKFVVLLKALRNRLEDNPQAGMGRLDLSMPDGSDAQTVSEVAALKGMDTATAALAVLQAENAPVALVQEAKDVYGGLGSHNVSMGVGTVVHRAQMVQRGRRYLSEDERDRRRRMRRRKKKREKKALHAGPDSRSFNDSICIMLSVSPAGHYVWPGGTKEEDLHVTLAWYGTIDPKDERTALDWIEGARRVADKYEAFLAHANGITRFSTPNEDGLDPIVVNIDAKEIEELRQDVLKEFGPHKSDHGFTPHMTLGYVDRDDPMPIQRYSAQPIFIDGIIVSHGYVNETIKFKPIGNKEQEDA